MTIVSAQAILVMPRAKAWIMLKDMTLAKRYVPGVIDIQITTRQDHGVGASRKVFVEGRPPLDETIVDWEDGHGFTVRLHQGDKPSAPFTDAHFVYRLDDAPNGQTQVTTTMVYELPAGIRWRVLNALIMQPATRRTVKAISRNLKQVYEAGAA